MKVGVYMKRILLAAVLLICLCPLFATNYAVSGFGVTEDAKSGKYFYLELQSEESSSKIDLAIYANSAASDTILFSDDAFMQESIKSVFGSINNVTVAGESFQFADSARNAISSTAHEIASAAKEYNTVKYSFRKGSLSSMFAAIFENNAIGFKATIACGKKKSFASSYDIQISNADKLADVLAAYNEFVASNV